MVEGALEDYQQTNQILQNQKDIEELQDVIRQLRQTLTAKFERHENRLSIVESVVLPDFKTADKEV